MNAKVAEMTETLVGNSMNVVEFSIETLEKLTETKENSYASKILKKFINQGMAGLCGTPMFANKDFGIFAKEGI